MTRTFYFDFVTENINSFITVFFLTILSNKYECVICDDK